MIGTLRGTLIQKQAPLLLVEVSGIGYELFAPMSTFYHLPEINNPVQLLTHFVVREDAQILYGFLRNHERLLFRTLIKVSGIGPKAALSILSGMTVDDFTQCVESDDALRLTRIPGIGKKTAERLIVELRHTISQWQTDMDKTPQTSTHPGRLQEAISALTALGYKTHQAKQVMTRVYKPEHSSEDLIRLALQQMAG